MKHNADDYLNYDPFEGDMDADIRCRTVKLVRTRAPHDCATWLEPHTIEPGTMARFDKAFVDGSHWGSYYTCTACMDQWLDEVIGLDGDEYFDELGAVEPEPPYRCERTADMFGGAA